jgi:hypothetical protein
LAGQIGAVTHIVWDMINTNACAFVQKEMVIVFVFDRECIDVPNDRIFETSSNVRWRVGAPEVRPPVASDEPM